MAKPGRVAGKPGYAKPGPKPGKLGDRIKNRMESFNGFPVRTELPNSSTEFYDRAEKILDIQLVKMSGKSKKSFLDFNEIRIVMELIKGKLMLDSKQRDLPTDTTDESVQAALKLLNRDNTKEPNEPNTENAKTTKAE